MSIVDLRSDTVTRPTPEMRQAIASAQVGDDVYGEDPTVSALESLAADLIGKEAALFVPTGTMANQVSIRAHTEPGDEIIVSDSSHIFLYEGGAFAALSGVSVHCVAGQQGLISAAGVQAAIRPPGGMSHFPTTRLVCLENTANRGGGIAYPLEVIQEITVSAKQQGLRLHLDGARLFNATVLQGVTPAEISEPFDSIAFCLSKGLGCPVGSLIVGSKSFIQRCHRFRKMFGGGMRQAGVLAAAGLYALEHNVARLAEDHRRARILAEAVSAMDGFEVNLEHVQTNMVYIETDSSKINAAGVCNALLEKGVAISPVNSSMIRAVTHLDVDDRSLERAIDALRDVSLRLI